MRARDHYPDKVPTVDTVEATQARLGAIPGEDGSPDQVLRRLEISVTKRLDGVLQGDYRGLIPGHGSEPGETRRYAAGDDVRRMDWNVTARTQAPHIRETIADRELETWLVVDLSPSLYFGTASYQKKDLSLAAAATAGFLTARGGNRIGAVLATMNGPEVIPARTGRNHLRALLSRIANHPRPTALGHADLAGAVERVMAPNHRRGLAVVVSDFLADEAWARSLGVVGTRHETLAVEVVDPRELELPAVGVLEVTDPATGAVRQIQTSKADVRRKYAAAAAKQRGRIEGHIRSARADHLQLRTDEDWLPAMVRFVGLRRERQSAIARAGGAS